MWFSNKKTSGAPESSGNPPPPPWENIDAVPKRVTLPRRIFNLTGYVVKVTGFSRFEAKFLLLGFALAIGFLSYILFQKSQQLAPLPPNVNRPAMDATATTTMQKSTSTTPQ